MIIWWALTVPYALAPATQHLFRKIRQHLPGGARYDVLNTLIRYYVGFEFVFEVQLALRATEVPEFRLGRGERGLRLGWETWLPRERTADEVVDDVSFVITN